MYFSSFPMIPYTLDNGKTWQMLRDITIRTRIIEESFNQTGFYHYYAISDGATLENIAEEMYGTPYLHWIIMLVNDIIDPVMEWPWSDQQLQDYTYKKYRKLVNGSYPAPEIVLNETHHVEDKDGIIKQSATLPSDVIVTNYEFESLRNESHREIRILRPEYVRDFLQQFKRLINE